MHLLAIRRSTTALIGAVGLVVGAAAMPAPRAGASETIINTWLQGWRCAADGNGRNMCLWYHPGLDGAYWGSFGSPINLDSTRMTFDLSDYSVIPGERTQGLNQIVANNAGSMADSTSNCTVDAYVYGNLTGNYDHLSPGWAGNLSTGLHNNEGSIAYYCS